MTSPPPERRVRALALVAVVTLLAAGSAWVLPAWDAVLPGGAIVWQAGAVGLALIGAFHVRRRLSDAGRWSMAGVVRLAASAALVVALAWAAGIGVLWLVWPR
jgi:hypothetical protein